MLETDFNESQVEEKDSLNFEVVGSEKIEPMFWDSTQITVVSELYRINTPNGRIYFRIQPNGEPIFYGGATSITQEMPQEESLIQWISAKGYSEAKRTYYLRSLFGSMEHSKIAQLAIDGSVDLDDIPRHVAEYFHNQNFYISEKEQRELALECQKDLISMARWVKDFNVRFIGIELPVFSDSEGIATLIDIVARCTEGEEEFVALINYKSSKKGFRIEHRFQLETEKQLFASTFPEFAEQDLRSYNLSAVAWRKTNWTRKEGQKGKVAKPYSFSQQMENFPHDRYNAYMELARDTRERKLNRPITTITGEMNLGDDVLKFISTKTIREIVMSGDWKKYEKSGKAVPETI